MPTALEQLNASIDKIGAGFDTFKKTNTERLEKFEKWMKEMQDMDLPGNPGWRDNPERPPRTGSPDAKSAVRRRFNEFLRKNDPAILESKDFSIQGGDATGAGTVPTIIANELYQKAAEVSPIINEVTRT